MKRFLQPGEIEVRELARRLDRLPQAPATVTVHHQAEVFADGLADEPRAPDILVDGDAAGLDLEGPVSHLDVHLDFLDQLRFARPLAVVAARHVAVDPLVGAAQELVERKARCPSHGVPQRRIQDCDSGQHAVVLPAPDRGLAAHGHVEHLLPETLDLLRVFADDQIREALPQHAGRPAASLGYSDDPLVRVDVQDQTRCFWLVTADRSQRHPEALLQRLYQVCGLDLCDLQLLDSRGRRREVESRARRDTGRQHRTQNCRTGNELSAALSLAFRLFHGFRLPADYNRSP